MPPPSTRTWTPPKRSCHSPSSTRSSLRHANGWAVSRTMRRWSLNKTQRHWPRRCRHCVRSFWRYATHRRSYSADHPIRRRHRCRLRRCTCRKRCRCRCPPTCCTNDPTSSRPRRACAPPRIKPALSAGYGRGGFDWSTFTSPAGAIWSVGATLSQPLFHGGALRARKRQYADLYDAAQSAYRQTVLAAFENVADTLASLDEDANALAQSSRAADAALRTEADAQARFRLGALPWSATLSAGQQYQNARVALVRARAARLADRASLFQAMGERPPVARGGPLRE